VDGSQQDLHEFLACFLDYLHEDVNRATIAPKKPSTGGKSASTTSGSLASASTAGTAGGGRAVPRAFSGGAGAVSGGDVDRNPGEESGDEGVELDGGAHEGRDEAVAAAVAWCKHLQRNKSVMGEYSSFRQKEMSKHCASPWPMGHFCRDYQRGCCLEVVTGGWGLRAVGVMMVRSTVWQLLLDTE
jgi:hypothetical protein